MRFAPRSVPSLSTLSARAVDKQQPWPCTCIEAVREKPKMRNLILRAWIRMQTFRDALKEEDGQDMVEYAVVMGLLALGATASMKALATTIGAAFTSVGTKLTTYTS